MENPEEVARQDANRKIEELLKSDNPVMELAVLKMDMEGKLIHAKGDQVTYWLEYEEVVSQALDKLLEAL